MRTLAAVLLALCALLVPARAVQQPGPTRALSVVTTEVTSPAITVSPDGQSIVFTALGQLFRLPAAGGAATQLTSGPYYHSDPVFSPDGTRLAFVSNRDGSGSNIFVMELSTRRIAALTREVEATRPAWSPDGRTIAYARNLMRDEHPLEALPGFADTGLREIRIVPAAGGASASAGPPRTIETVFFLPDGRLGWSVREVSPGGGMFQTTKASRIEVRAADGSVSVLAAAPGDLGRVVIGPAGDGVYYAARGSVQWLKFGGEPVPVGSIRLRDGGTRLALSRGEALIFGDGGQIVRAALPSGEPRPTPFTATIALEARPLVRRTWTAPPARADAPVRAVMAPSVSTDGARVAVIGAGFVWEQPLERGEARRLVDSAAFMRDPAYSPDGRSLAVVASEHGKRELRVYDRATGQARTLASFGGAAWPLHPSWSPDGSRIVFQHTDLLGAPFRIVIVKVADGTTEDVAQTVGSWVARPHFSGDGRSIYFTNRPDKIGTLYRVSVPAAGPPQPLTDLSRHVHEGLVSPDGKWLAHRRNSEIWIAPLGTGPVRDADLRRFSAEGGRSFSFTSDAAAIVYSAGGRVWRQPISGGERLEIPVHATVATPRAAPVLVTNVRVLDFVAGRFGEPTSMYLQDGRIQWIGDARGRDVPAAATRLDAGGRYAIPGLFDAHVHSAWANQQTNEDAFLAFGVTSVRDTGSSLDLLTALDDRADLTALPAPRYFYSGEIFEGTMPHWGDAFYTIGSEAEARAEVQNLRARGADFVKIYPSLPWHLQQVVVDEAHRAGLPIVGHGLSVEEITRRVLWGSASVEHSGAIFTTYEDGHRLLAAAGTRADLTLSVGGGTLMRASDPEWLKNWRVLEYVPENTRRPGQGTGGPFALGRADQPRDELLGLFKPRFDKIMAARERGVRFAGGTDALMGGVYFGLSLHWELAQFADAGLNPVEVLRMATEGAAALVGASADLGTLAPGKLADVVLLDANPVENIRNTQRIWRVVKGGRVFDPSTMRPGIAVTAGQ
jgi:Tol biopolymer transport system component/imidazolonepropionase-like amidohydrolase